MPYRFTDVWTQIAYYYSNIMAGLPEKASISLIPALFSTWFVGEWFFFELWFLFNVIDLGLGVTLAKRTGQYQSARLHGWVVKTLTHTGTICLFGIVTLMLNALNPFGRSIPLTDWFMFVLVLTEAASILDSANRLGWPVHPFVAVFISKLRRRVEVKIDDVTSLGGDDNQENPDENHH